MFMNSLLLNIYINLPYKFNLNLKYIEFLIELDVCAPENVASLVGLKSTTKGSFSNSYRMSIWRVGACHTSLTGLDTGDCVDSCQWSRLWNGEECQEGSQNAQHQENLPRGFRTRVVQEYERKKSDQNASFLWLSAAKIAGKMQSHLRGKKSQRHCCLLLSSSQKKTAVFGNFRGFCKLFRGRPFAPQLLAPHSQWLGEKRWGESKVSLVREHEGGHQRSHRWTVWLRRAPTERWAEEASLRPCPVWQHEEEQERLQQSDIQGRIEFSNFNIDLCPLSS